MSTILCCETESHFDEMAQSMSEDDIQHIGFYAYLLSLEELHGITHTRLSEIADELVKISKPLPE